MTHQQAAVQQALSSGSGVCLWPACPAATHTPGNSGRRRKGRSSVEKVNKEQLTSGRSCFSCDTPHVHFLSSYRCFSHCSGSERLKAGSVCRLDCCRITVRSQLSAFPPTLFVFLGLSKQSWEPIRPKDKHFTHTSPLQSAVDSNTVNTSLPLHSGQVKGQLMDTSGVRDPTQHNAAEVCACWDKIQAVQGKS